MDAREMKIKAAEAALASGVKAAAAKALEGARPTEQNTFKLTLAERKLAAVLGISQSKANRLMQKHLTNG